MIGTKVLHYNIIEKIGEGGMGEVFLAEDEKLHRRVALKFLHGDFQHDAEAHERLFREARSASKLSHPNIVAIHAIEETDDHVFIAMEHVRGESLRKLVRAGNVDIDRALEIAPQILAALASAHETSVVHRDIKSDNIVITESGHAKVLDFGLAKAKGAASVTRHGSSAGTPAYMSPEQVQGGGVDHRSDLFSFGVVLYEMLTGRMPFKGEHESAVTYSIVNETPEPLSSYNRDLPEGLQGVVDRCLEKNIDKRYQSAVEIEADLARVRAGVGVAPSAPRAAARGRKPARGIYVTLAVVVVLGALAVNIMRGNGGDTNAPVALAESTDSGRKMLAVLPFENLGPTDQEYFADGVTEEITTRLAQLSGLGVISRTSAAQYKGTDKSLREIGKELGVDFVLEGTIRWDRSGESNRVRVSAQLIRADDDTHLWADTFDRVYDQIFELQSELAEEVAKALNVTLLEPELAALNDRPTENLDAYDLFLKARERFDSGTGMEDRQLATTMLEQAVTLDSTFATAHALLARIYSNDHFNDIATDMPRLEQALKAAQAALRHAPNQPQGHVAMGYYHYYGSRDYDNALAEFAEASKAQPNNAEMLEAMGYVQRRQGHWDEAVRSLERSVKLDPASRDKTSNLIETLIRMRDFDKVDVLIAHGNEVSPNNPQFEIQRGLRAFLQGDTALSREIIHDARERFEMEGLRDFESQIQLASRNYDSALSILGPLGGWENQDTSGYYTNKGLIYHCMGEPDKASAYYDSARIYLRERIAGGADGYQIYSELAQCEAYLGNEPAARAAIDRAEEIMPMSLDALSGTDVIINRAVVKMMLGDDDGAIDDLQFLLSIPSNITPGLLRLHPGFDSLRDNPRFQKITEEKVNS